MFMSLRLVGHLHKGDLWEIKEGFAISNTYGYPVSPRTSPAPGAAGGWVWDPPAAPRR